ncbi:MAG: Gfo/Idh/MocA family oxidoreductase [Prolixibacteraceae bacterium]|jgi:predicted dehydrogenase|nr:Gfo/Idh/MocA family oxidoreductase [Prolixibacteraceae bacterium]
MSDPNFSRRKFLANAAAISAVGVVGVGALSSCAEKKKVAELNLPPLLDQAPDGKPLKAGIIGCGGRGSGAMLNFLDAGPNLSIHSLGDVFQDRINDCQKKLKKEKGLEVPAENCFVGFDAYQKVIDSGVDVVILATPPKFRPEHFEAAIKARKHVFMEKPVAVDPVGIRSVLASGKMADSLGLVVVAGTQRRHERSYIDLLKQVKQNDAIGEIISSNAYWNSGKLWHRNPTAEWSEMEYMIRDWVNWCWLSGDHIVEQHVHNLDVIHWFTGSHPIKAVGFGSRQRRLTGDQFDNFSIDYTFPNGMHMHSMCRQINGCANGVYEIIHGTKGRADTTGHKPKVIDMAGNVIFEAAESSVNPYVQEHIDMVTCIRQGSPMNEAESVAVSCLVAMMGRVSAYTGKEVTFDEMMNSDIKLGPDTYVMGDIGYMKTAGVPVAGEAAEA